MGLKKKKLDLITSWPSMLDRHVGSACNDVSKRLFQQSIISR